MNRTLLPSKWILMFKKNSSSPFSSLLIKILQVSRIKFQLIFNWWIFKIAKNWTILNRLNPRLRPALWRMTGCNIGEKVSIGYDVYYDVSNSAYINIEDEVWIASRSLLLCHKRDLKEYYKNESYNKLPYQKHPVKLKKGCVIGMGSIIMPGVTIGEGAIVGAGSLVVKDVPAWTIAVGNPAKVVKDIPKRKIQESSKVINIDKTKEKKSK